jgi:hypothetical protein
MCFLAASLSLCCATVANAAPAAKSIEITQLDGHVPNFATFDSDIPHVATNGHGIFVVYLSHEARGALTKNWGNIFTWTLKRSSDGGRTFSVVASGPPRYGKAPEIETDEDDNIYLFDGDYSPPGTDPDSTNLIVYEFQARQGYRFPHIVRVPGEAAGKFSCIYDKPRHLFYYIGFGQTQFLVLDRNMRVVRRLQLLKNGVTSGMQYPQMTMDGPRLYLAWTTSPLGDCGGGPGNWHCSEPVYDSIRLIYSDDAGETWMAPGGKPLELPVVSDARGPAPDLVPESYKGRQAAWLAGFTAWHGVIHVMFQVTPLLNQVYEAFSIMPFKRLWLKQNIYGPPAITEGLGAGGFTVFSPDGILVHDGQGILYAVALDSSKQQLRGKVHAIPLAVFASMDGGHSWNLVAERVEEFAGNPEIDGPRVVLGSYGIVGIFTGSTTGSWGINGHQIYFFRVP